MKKILYILTTCFLFCCIANAQRKVLGLSANHVETGLTGQPVLFFISGESNATGDADDVLATSPELSPRNLKILNNENYNFERLEIGANNILNTVGGGDITNCPTCSTHGMELQLANSYDSGYWLPHPCYLVKAGQGGSTISQWDIGDAYYDSLVNRLDRAINLIIAQTGQEPIIIWMFELGANDMNATTPPSTFKTAAKNHIDNIRGEIYSILGHAATVPVLMMRFDGAYPNFQDYETIIGEIDSEVTECYAIPTTTILKDTVHWQYEGAKENVRTMKTLIQSLIAL